MLDQPDALTEVAREALRLCHFDPATGADVRRAPGAKEDCEAACYDCLMSYYNQMDHELLDRQLIREVLLELTSSTVKASPMTVNRAEHLRRLKALCESDLEREWLDFLGEAVPAEQAALSRRHERTGRPLGSDRFVRRVEKLLGRIPRPRSPRAARASEIGMVSPELRAASMSKPVTIRIA